MRTGPVEARKLTVTGRIHFKQILWRNPLGPNECKDLSGYVTAAPFV